MIPVVKLVKNVNHFAFIAISALLMLPTLLNAANEAPQLDSYGPPPVLNYSVTICREPTTNPRLWSTWVDVDMNESTRSAASGFDDNYMASSLSPIDVQAPFFRYVSTVNLPKFYPTSNGFLSLTPYVFCPYFCEEYYYSPVRHRGPNWPLVALYVDDLDPRKCNASAGIFVSRRRVGTTEEDASIVSYIDIPLFSERSLKLNLTAQVEIRSSGAFIFRYKSVPPPPDFESITPMVGLAVSSRLKVLTETPQWIRPGEENKLSVYAIRFDPDPQNDCTVLKTCEACTLRSAAKNCTWCARTAVRMPNGETKSTAACLRSPTDAVCLPQHTYVDQCTSAQLPSPQYDTHFDWVSLQPDHSGWTAIGDGEQCVLQFSFPFFYNPDPSVQLNISSSRVTSALTFHSDGTVTSSYKKDLSAMIISPLSSTFTAAKTATLYKKMPRRPLSPNALCSRDAAGSCCPAVAFSWEEVSPSNPTPNRNFSFKMVLHETGHIDFYYDQSFTVWANYPDFFIGLLWSGTADGSPAKLDVPWTMISTGLRISFTPLPSCPPCKNGGVCDIKTSRCVCKKESGFVGPACAICTPGFFETILNGVPHCIACAGCANGGTCDWRTGLCLCAPEFDGPRCETECPTSVDSGKRAEMCNPSNCNFTQGYCECGECRCLAGWRGPMCDTRSIFNGTTLIVVVVLLFAATLTALAFGFWVRPTQQAAAGSAAAVPMLVVPPAPPPPTLQMVNPLLQASRSPIGHSAAAHSDSDTASFHEDDLL